MSDGRKLHGDFTKELNDLIIKFNADHPDLFVKDIDINYNELRNGTKFYLGTRVEISVQPFEEN